MSDLNMEIQKSIQTMDKVTKHLEKQKTLIDALTSVVNHEESRLVKFYFNDLPTPDGYSLAQIQRFSNEQIEASHSTIQWLFPVRRPSNFNLDAPLLTQADIELFHHFEDLSLKLRNSFSRFLKFLGIDTNFPESPVFDRISESHMFSPSEDWEDRNVILKHPNHNWLRITRVFVSLNLLGLSREANKLYEFLADAQGNGLIKVSENTFEYWRQAANGKEV